MVLPGGSTVPMEPVWLTAKTQIPQHPVSKTAGSKNLQKQYRLAGLNL
jgi:hypothetical protein